MNPQEETLELQPRFRLLSENIECNQTQHKTDKKQTPLKRYSVKESPGRLWCQSSFMTRYLAGGIIKTNEIDTGCDLIKNEYC